MKTKRLPFLFYVFLIFFNNFSNAQQPLIPARQKVLYGKSKFLLARAEIIVPKRFSSKDRNTLDQFVLFVKQRTGIVLSYKHSESDAIKFVFKINSEGFLLPMTDEKTGPQSREAYRLNITSKQISISANASAGFCYALQTLRQLIVTDEKNSYVPQVDIEDYPGLAYRGIMMDVAHGGVPTEQEIKNKIDFLAQ